MKKRAKRRTRTERIINKRIDLLKNLVKKEPKAVSETYFEHIIVEPHRLAETSIKRTKK
jgi:hypothetical protein